VANLSDDHTARIQLSEEELKYQKSKLMKEADKLEETRKSVDKMQISKVD